MERPHIEGKDMWSSTGSNFKPTEKQEEEQGDAGKMVVTLVQTTSCSNQKHRRNECEVLAAVAVRSRPVIFWNVTLCSLTFRRNIW